jgi:hypothetical protein
MLNKNIILALFAVIMTAVFGFNTASAQFSKPVVMLQGTVQDIRTEAPVSVNVSIREAGNVALELTASRSNSESGKYLVVLKPNTKYWVHIEGEGIEAFDELIETPSVTKTQTITKNFLISVLPLHNTAKK